MADGSGGPSPSDGHPFGRRVAEVAQPRPPLHTSISSVMTKKYLQLFTYFVRVDDVYLCSIDPILLNIVPASKIISVRSLLVLGLRQGAKLSAYRFLIFMDCIYLMM